LAGATTRALTGTTRSLIGRLSPDGPIVSTYVAGETEDRAVAAAAETSRRGLRTAVDRRVPDAPDRAAADATVASYLDVLRKLASAGLAEGADMSVRPSAIGAGLPDGNRIALDRAQVLGDRAAEVGASVTFDMQDHRVVDSTLALVHALREDHPTTGVALQARLHRTEADCRDLSGDGFRVRLCKGAYDEPPGVAFQRDDEIDRAYVRCTKVLLAGDGYPMIATHDTRLIEIAGSLAARFRRDQSTYEFQFAYGVRPEEQDRLVHTGETVRVWIPYGPDWSGYVARRVRTRPTGILGSTLRRRRHPVGGRS
jgi:proline dehydrogenase